MTFEELIYPTVTGSVEPLMVIFTLALVFDYLRSMLFGK